MSFIAKLVALVISFSLCAAGLLFMPRKSETKTERQIQTQTPVLLRNSAKMFGSVSRSAAAPKAFGALK